ncbi:response regulator [Candidatus Poribacteria bacterium]|nr:response regulator [Candidatus Poribacteria bacterium]
MSDKAENIKILVVEDEGIVAQHIKKILERIGYTVSKLVSSGEKAIDFIKQERPNLVLMDIMLKGQMDGIDTAQQIRNKFNIPVVYLTAYADNGTLQRAKQTEPYGYLVKPFQEKDLRTTIEMAIYKHKMESKLAESEERFYQLVNLLPEIVFETDINNNIIFANQTAFREYGYTPEKLKSGLNAYDTIIPEEREKAKRNFSRIIEGEKIGGTEYTALRSDGSTFPVIIHSTPIIKNDKICGLRGIVFNLTKVKEAEQEIIRQRDKAQRYLDVIEVMMITLNVDQEITLINRKACEILGYEENEILGKKWFDNFIPESEREIEKSNFKRLIAGDIEQIKYYENSVLTKYGERIIAWHNSLLTNENGKIIGTLSSGEDVTEKRKMEQDILRMQKLESIGMLAGGIAHDFNNILTAVLGNISLARIYEDAESVDKRLEAAERALDQARSLTQQLLTFSRGGMPLKEAISVEELLKESAILALRGSRAVCEFDIAPDLWPIEADENQLSQVISNIVMNADQSMPEGGIVTISAINTRVKQNQFVNIDEGDYIKISIQDTGIGIPKKHLDRIFEPYFSTKQKGSGLGLAVSYSIIEKHEGYIDVETEQGVGSTFHIYLPRLIEDETEDKQVDEKALFESREVEGKILVMDDEEPIRELSEAILSNLGYQVVTVENGESAIEIYKRAMNSGETFDAVILDLTIPGGMSGKDTIEVLLEIDPDIKAIVSSGYYDDPVMSDYKNYGFKGVIKKPYVPKDMIEVLQKL